MVGVTLRRAIGVAWRQPDRDGSVWRAGSFVVDSRLKPCIWDVFWSHEQGLIKIANIYFMDSRSRLATQMYIYRIDLF